MLTRLIYVSNNVRLSDGKQNPFFLQEKAWLLERFGAFDVISPNCVYRCEDMGDLRQIKKISRLEKMLSCVGSMFDPEVYKELIHMLRDKKCTVRNVLKLFRFSARTAKMYRILKKHVKETGCEDTVLYSYWLSFDAAAVAKMKRKFPQIYAFARAHAYEIQLERNACNPYLMKRLICKTLDKVAFISENAKDGFCGYYKEPFSNACVQYLGSDQLNAGFVARGKKETLTVLTCSSILPVKRLERMIEALSHWQDGPIRWIHIGDGADGEMIRKMAQDNLTGNSLVTSEFAGSMNNRQVHEFLTDANIDVFVNCSKTEGVPVSIMEAMSVGLPVIAPKMFGIPELVRDGCGLLFEQSEGYENLLEALKTFHACNQTEREKMGKAAYRQWAENFCLQTNLQTLFSFIKD